MPKGGIFQHSLSSENVGTSDANVGSVSYTDEMVVPTQLGTRIRNLRLSRKLRQAEVADAVGVSRSFLSSIETGGDYPGRETLSAIADYFHVTIDYLQSGTTTGLPSRGGPLGGQFVDDPDELALLRFWRGLTDAERLLFLKMVKPGRAGEAA